MKRTVVRAAVLPLVIIVLRILFAPAALPQGVCLSAGAGVYVSGSDQATVTIDNDTAYDMTDGCVISVPSDENGYAPGTDGIHDGRTDTYMRLPENGALYWQVTLRTSSAQGIYIQWEYVPGAWTFEARDKHDKIIYSGEHGGGGYVQEYVPMPEETKSFRIIQHEECLRPLSILELSVWSFGTLPDSVHTWDPTPSRCELMLVSAHQDDELLFFGGALPYYAAGRQYDTVVVYMANCGSERIHEALNGLWVCGVRQYPLFLNLPDVKSLSIKAARRTWDEESVTDALAELFLRYQPQVVITHDIDGEYGHGQHSLTAVCVQHAIAMCADSGEAQRLVPGAEPYEVPKCYLHLWAENPIYIDWIKLPVERLGMTAAEAAVLGYEEHESQHQYFDEVFFDEPYDCRLFGLYHTNVGNDVERNDFFENITPRIVNPETVPSPPDSGFFPVLHSGFVWRGGPDGEPVYIRYGAVDGNAGWFLCDSTGALMLDGGHARPFRRNFAQALGGLIAADGTAETDAAQQPMQCPDPDRQQYVAGFSRGVLAAAGLFAAALSVILIIIIRTTSRRSSRRNRKKENY